MPAKTPAGYREYRSGRHSGVLERSPARLEAESLLGVHADGLSRGDPEEFLDRTGRRLEESAP